MIFSGYKCDKCGATVTVYPKQGEQMNTKSDLLKFARLTGWQMGKRVLCPRCKYEIR